MARIADGSYGISMGTAVEQAASARRARVLLAGADQVGQTHMEQLLTRSGYEVVAVRSDGEAQHVFESNDPPRLAVLDWDLPGGAKELCRKLRREKRHRDAYLILLTHWNEPNERVEGLEAGADDCLYKPVDVRELRIKLNLGTQTILERALRESEERFRSAFECAGIGMALVKVTGEILQINQSLCSFLGYSGEELLQRNFHDLAHPADVPSSRELLEQYPEGVHRSHEFERRFLRRGGTTGWAAVTLSTVLDADQHSVSFLLQVQDIAERKKAQENLRAANAATELFLQSIPSILIGLDHQGHITRWNPMAALTLGVAAETVIGRTMEECGIKWLSANFRDEISQWLRTETFRSCDSLTFERNNLARSLGLHIRRISKQSEGTTFLITGADITERKTLEEQLRQAQKLEAIGQLSAGIAHEINTPTQFVGDNIRFLKESWSGVSEVLRICQCLREEHTKGSGGRQLLDRLDGSCESADIEYLLKEVPHALDQAIEGVRRVAKIVRAMKEFSHPGEEEKLEIDINKAIETTVTVAKNEWKYVADVCLHLDSTLPTVACHSGELNQVLVNLIVNAAHAIAARIGESDAKGRITISTRRSGECVEIAIEDTGSGIPEAIRSRVFEPFFTTKPVGQGTGQGLALAHSVVVNRHQGQIWFESVLQKGTTFFIRLPLAAAGLRK